MTKTRSCTNRAVVSAAMRLAKVWLDQPGKLKLYRGNNGLLVKLLRACARHERATRGR